MNHEHSGASAPADSTCCFDPLHGIAMRSLIEAFGTSRTNNGAVEALVLSSLADAQRGADSQNGCRSPFGVFSLSKIINQFGPVATNAAIERLIRKGVVDVHVANDTVRVAWREVLELVGRDARRHGVFS